MFSSLRQSMAKISALLLVSVVVGVGAFHAHHQSTLARATVSCVNPNQTLMITPGNIACR